MDNTSCVALAAQCVMNNISCAAPIALGSLFILSLFYHRTPTIPLKYYLSMFALPIVILAYAPESWPSQGISAFEDIPKYSNAFAMIASIISVHLITPILLKPPLRRAARVVSFIAVILFALLRVYCPKILSIILLVVLVILFIIYMLLGLGLCWHEELKKVMSRYALAINNCLFVVSISVILLLVYIQLSKSLFGSSSGGSSGSDLAICVAIIGACATLYNVQRTSKQELTKNRQDWITTVRLETAKIISTFDLLKYALLNGAKRDEIISKSKSLLESCNKVRMFMNPSDTIAPIIIAQLDAIVNYCNILLNWQDTSKISIIQSIHQINLHKSLMPWVQVLLKVEWERVKDVLESKEETSDGFYSKDVYEHEWSKGKLEEYGIKVPKNTSDIIKVPKNTSDIIDELFPGFKFCVGDKVDIAGKLNELKIMSQK